MKEDLLEQFIRKHKDEWDDKKAPKEVWENVQKELPSPQTPSGTNWRIIAIALGTVLVFLLAYLFLIQPENTSNTEPVELLEYAELPEFRKTEDFYLSAIYASEQKVNEQHIDATLEEDLSLLDQSTEELREEYKLAQGAYKEVVLRGIIMNHQMKLQILERVLQNIQSNQIPTNEKIY